MPVQSFDWRIQVYGSAKESLQDDANAADVKLHELKWTARMQKVQSRCNAFYLVRPDALITTAETD